MGIKSILSVPWAKLVRSKHKAWARNPWKYQARIFENLILEGRRTRFGKDHGLGEVRSYEDFTKVVPIRDYEGLKPYIERIIKGEQDQLWPGKPIYFAKTSGTTSGSKFIPITKDSIGNHINTARDALLSYIADSGNSTFLDGRLIFLSGSPEMDKTGGIHTGRLSGIVNHHVPQYLRSNQLPSYGTNCIEDWETKLQAIIKETKNQNMTLISGIPPWVQMYFDYLMEETGKSVGDIFPNFSLMVHGGVNFQPYANKLYESIGRRVDTLETFPASEGFFAFQDTRTNEGLLLNIDSGIFFEFIPMDEYHSENPQRLSLRDVEVGKNYSLIINSKAGLWGYEIGDTVKFVSTNPYRLVVTGRVSHFISAFGEHVIAEEVERSLELSRAEFPEIGVIEFTVAPEINPEKGKSCHEWLIEFSNPPSDMEAFSSSLDKHLQESNSYYKDLIQGSILRPLRVIDLKKDAFREFMKEKGKLGGQNKVPRLANNRDYADGLLKFRNDNN